MKQTFSFRRFCLLARKHYAENRTNYLIGLGGYLLFILLGLYGALREDKPSLSMFEAIITFTSVCTPIALAKMSFAPYILPNRQVEAFTLPATRNEKFIFSVVNTLLVSALAIVGVEVVASLVAPRLAILNDFEYVRSIAGHWFAGLGGLLMMAIIFGTSAIFACTATRKGNVAVAMFATWLGIVLLYSFPTLLINFDGWSVATMEFPGFIATFNNHIDIGNTVMECTTQQLLQGSLWTKLALPIVLLVAAWFKFREYETK